MWIRIKRQRKMIRVFGFVVIVDVQIMNLNDRNDARRAIRILFGITNTMICCLRNSDSVEFE